jgi:hypothetical protein
LTDRIAAAVSFDLSDFRPTGGHTKLREKLEHFQYYQREKYNSWLVACDYIKKNIHLSSSVDRFIDSNRDNETAVEICKLIIGLLISDFEKSSPYGFEPHEIRNFHAYNVKDRWTTKLFQYLHINITRNEIDEIFARLKIVSFNYDRLIEQALITSLVNFYNVSIDDAVRAVEKLEVVHVYGSLGSLRSSDALYQSFGNFVNDPLVATRQIRTFHESVTSDISARIADYIKWSKRIFILGFSFADMNTAFLRECAGELKGIKPVFATCFGMSEQNVDVARAMMSDTFASGQPSTRMLPLTCEQFFDDLALTI